jgi:methylenetetrahydrofolate reductase (NADPH)
MTSSTNPELSFEFFPARTESGLASLAKVHQELAKFEPKYFSVTFGAGGSTQDGTYNAVKSMIDAGSNAAPHLTCVGCSRAYIKSVVQSYLDIGVNRFVVLRGDLPGGMLERGYFKYATDLVGFIRSEFGDELHLEVAAYPDFHPESKSPQRELEHFKNKVDAGANSALTQYFYNADSYFAFIDEITRMGVDIPIIPGVMPISNYANLVRFSDKCGAELPRWIRARLEQYQHDEASLKSFGLDVVTHLCFDLLDNGVEGLHFYAMNKIDPVKEICDRIGFQQS